MAIGNEELVVEFNSGCGNEEFNSGCSRARVFGKTLVHEFPFPIAITGMALFTQRKRRKTKQSAVR